MTMLTRRMGYADRRVWEFSGYEVLYLHLDYRFAFDCAATHGRDGYLAVTINIPFSLATPESTRIHDPENLESIGGAVIILHRWVISLTVFASGRLEAEFSGGIKLSVDNHPLYESWEARGRGELADIAFVYSPHEGPPWRE